MTSARIDKWIIECLRDPSHFTTSRFLGRGKYDTREFKTLAAAQDDAAGDRRAMIYLVTNEGRSAHLAAADIADHQQALELVGK